MAYMVYSEFSIKDEHSLKKGSLQIKVWNSVTWFNSFSFSHVISLIISFFISFFDLLPHILLSLSLNSPHTTDFPLLVLNYKNRTLHALTASSRLFLLQCFPPIDLWLIITIKHILTVQLSALQCVHIKCSSSFRHCLHTVYASAKYLLSICHRNTIPDVSEALT